MPYGHDIADNWLLKDDTEANEVMESGIEFHSVIVLAAKDFWNRVEVIFNCLGCGYIMKCNEQIIC